MIYNQEAIAVEAAYTMIAVQVTQILERTIHEQGKPKGIRVGNGLEFNSKELRDWFESKDITVQVTQPYKLKQNGYIKHFNRTFGEIILNA